MNNKKQKPDIVFINDKSECGCKLAYSDGHGEYSDVLRVWLCEKHKAIKKDKKQC